MRQLLKSVILDILASVKLYPTVLTEKKDILSLLHSLFPISLGKELIRLGPRGDGGYLVPDDLSGIEACFSPGVSLISGFEKDCANLGIKVFLADRSVDKPVENHNLFDFTKKFVGATTNDDFMTMDAWVNSSIPRVQTNLLLQMDIEGSEYETILNMSDALMQRFRIIVIEFHNLDQLWNRLFFQFASRSFEKILQTHTCIHIHPNNCCVPLKKWGLLIPPVAEFTFLRKDRIQNSSFATDFPHPMDLDNTDHPHYPLPRCWYQSQ